MVPDATRSGSRIALRALALASSFLLAVAAAAPLHAEERKHSVELSGFAGYTLFGNELQLDNGPDFGLRAGWYLAPQYELELQYYKTTGDSINKGSSTLIVDESVLAENPNRDWTATAYTVRFIVNPRNDRRRFKPYAQFGLGTMDWKASPSLDKSQEGDTNAYLLSVGAGAHYRFGAYTQFRVEFEDLYAIAEVYNNFHLNFGLAWVFGGGKPADSDGDGVLDLKDRCPDTPKGALVDKHDGCPWDLDRDGVMEGVDQCAATPAGWPVDEKGCPLDSDGDAVPDGLDKCPDTMKAAVVDANGCPADADKDGIFDGLDRCPGTPQGAIVDPVDSPTAGCPHDADNDGIFDGIDQCPLTPVGALADEKGCPKDSDGDKVLDGLDQCPDTAKGTKIDKEGCPRIRLDKTDPQLVPNVKFHGMELYPGSDAWLQLLVESANYWSDVVFEVGVYTDNEGGIAANRAAAQRRSEVLRAWLVNQGIPDRRFVVKAYGPVNFVADNSTEEGRDKNRRIEVKRLSGDIRRHPKPEPEPEAQPAPPPAAAEPPPAEPPPSTPPPAEPPATPPSGSDKPADAPAPGGDTAPSTPPASGEPAPAPTPDPAKPPSGGR
jgi:outer membrane protein with beta-barrel domain/OmpA family protein/thrombospondin type 3 repeat protein